MPDPTQRTQLLHPASFVPIGAFAGKPAMPLTRPVVIVGSGPHARFLLKSDTVSTSHTLLVHTTAGWYFRDLVSRTHTILNGKSLRESPINNGDTLTIGKFVFHCSIQGTAESVAPPAPASLEITDAEIPVPIDTRTVLIGRRVGCEVRLIEESVSLVHAALYEADGKHYVRDLYSRTGTFLNGKRVHESELKFGDVVVIGETTIKYVPDLTAGDISSDLVELEPFGVEETRPPRAANEDSILNGSISGGSVAGGSVAGGSLAGHSAAGQSALGDPTPAARAIDPASLIPIADETPRSSVASAAGVALSEVPPREEEIEDPTLSARAPLPLSPVSPPADERPQPELSEEEPAGVSLERLRTSQPLEVAEDNGEGDAHADGIVLPLNRRDVIDGPGPSDSVEVDVDEVPEEAARAADVQVESWTPEKIEAAEAEVEVEPVTETDAAAPSAEDIEADVLGIPAALTLEPLDIEPDRTPAPAEPEAIEPVGRQAPIAGAPSPFAVTPLPEAAAPLVAVDLVSPADQHDSGIAEPVHVEAIQDHPHANEVRPFAHVIDDHEHDDDHHQPIEPPGIEPTAVPQSAEAIELAALQARIRTALEDPSTMARQPLLPETPNAPAPILSEAARRAHTIAELLESNEEFEEAAERESEAIAMPGDLEVSPPPVVSFDEADVAASSLEAGYEAPAELPPLEPIVEPPPPAIDLAEAKVDEEAEAAAAIEVPADADANVVEPAGPSALAELIRVADAGVPTATRDVVDDAGNLSLAAGESAVVGDEEELAAASPAVSELTTAAAEEPRSDANDDALAIEAAADTVTAAPQGDVLSPEASLPVEVESPIGESAPDTLIDVAAEAPVPTPKGRRGRGKLPAAPKAPPTPKPRKATVARKPPRGKKGAVVVEEPTIDPNLAAAAALAASEADAALDPLAAALASNVEAATENALDRPHEIVTPDLAAAESRGDDLDTFADRVAEAGVDSLTGEPKADSDASFIEPAAVEEAATSIGSNEDRTAGITIETAEVNLESSDFSAARPIGVDDGEATRPAATIEVDAGPDVTPLETSLGEAGTDSLEAIAEAEQPETLEVEEVLVPSMLAAEPDELQTVIEDDRAPVEADAVTAGEAIMTSPVEIDELEVELVSPMIDPDPGVIAEREALDTKEESEEQSAELGAGADLVGGKEIEAATDLAFADYSASADAVAPALEVSVAAELAGPEAADTVGLDVEAIAEQGLDEAAESSVSFVSAEESAAADALPEAFAIAAEAEPGADAEALAPEVNGAWLAPADAVVADALEGVVSDTVSNSTDGAADAIIEQADETDFGTRSLELVGPAEVLEAAEPLSSGPAPMGGSTLSSGETLSLDLAEVEEELTVLGRIGPETLDRDEPTGEEPGIDGLAAKNDEPEEPRPVPKRSVLTRGNSPTTSVVNVNVPTLEDLESTFKDAFAEALAMADDVQAKFGAPPADPPRAAPPSSRPPAPKWELDESLLEQAEANAAARAAAPKPAAQAPPQSAAAFMSLGGIGWIGDESADEFEQIPASLRPMPGAMPGARTMLGGGVGQIGGAMAANRGSRRRRPVPGETSEANESKASEEFAEPSISPSVTRTDPTDAAAVTEAPADAMFDLDRAKVEESALDLSNEAIATELVSPPAPAPMMMPPRPKRPARPVARADVDESLASAASASPFAEQALPLVDAFSPATGPQPALDEMLAKFGGAEGRIKSTPSITQDRPAGGNTPTPSPFASQAPIDPVRVDEVDDGSPLPIGHSSIRRTRHQINKLPLLLGLMLVLMGVASLGAWQWPVPVTVRGDLTFKNLEKLGELDRANAQDRIRQKLDRLDAQARQGIDDRFSNGFLDRPELYARVVSTARFDPTMPSTLLIDQASSLNQVEGDMVRMNALMKQLVLASQDLLDAQRKLQDTAQAYDRTIARDRERRSSLALEIERITAVVQRGPEVRELKKAEADAGQAEEARKNAAAALDAVEAELKRLESNPLAFVPASMIEEERPMLADVSEIGVLPTTRPATGDAQAELDRLVTQLKSTKARLDQLEAAQSPERKVARDGFDSALEAFAGEVEAARKTLGDRPELLQYIESARQLQQQIRSMTETMIRRHQQQLTRLSELKQQLAEVNGSTRNTRMSGDEELKKWNDQIAINERRLNGAKADGASTDDVAEIESEISLLKSMVSAKEETLRDPGAASVDKKLEEIIAVTQREMEADRHDNEARLAEMQAAFNKQQPAVENLPQEQKQLGESLAGRLAQIDLARQRYANSLAQSAGSEAVQVTELREKVQQLEIAVAKQRPLAEADAVAQAADMDRRAAAAKLLDDARAKVLAARSANEAAVAAYESKSKSLASLVERRDAASAARQRADAIAIEEQAIESRMSTTIAERETNRIRLETAVVPDMTRGPGVRTIDAPHGDPRLGYGIASLALLGLLFTPLLIRESRNRPVVRPSGDSHRDSVMPGNAHVA